jgi:hypothetical protein
MEYVPKVKMTDRNTSEHAQLLFPKKFLLKPKEMTL